MKLYQKIKVQKDNAVVKKYKLLGTTILRKEKSLTKKKYNCLGVKICKKTGVTVPVFQQFEWPEYPTAHLLQTHKVVIIAELSLPQCKLYRVTNKIYALQELGYDVCVASWTDAVKCFKLLQLAEFVIFYRVPYIGNVPQYYAEANRLGIKKIFDIDDLIFDKKSYQQHLERLPLDNKLKEHFISDADIFLPSLENADEFWTTTEALASEAQKYINNIKLVPNCVPENLLHVIPQKYNDDKIRIFYGSGTSSHDSDFKLCFKALDKILLKYDQVELYIHGYLNMDNFSASIRQKIHHIDFVKAEDYYFAISGYDIAIAPLERNLFSEAKSNIKFIESAMLEIPLIASPLKEFSNVIKSGENGYIADTQADWENALIELIENHEKRKEIGKRAKETVLNLYSQEANIKYIQRAISPSKKELNISQKKKVLYVNVLYGYSSFGGATIVAEEIAQHFNHDYDDWQSYVFSCHIGHPENELIRYDWKGVPVFSVSVGNIDLRYQNSKINQKFQEIINIIKPDIVHIHCIQTIGIDICQTCKENNIPYIITMHDAWFVCPRQFFIDSNDCYCNQCLVSLETCMKRCSVSNKDFFERKNKMLHAVANATYVCTPSQTFSQQLQANFPFTKIGVNKNGISFVPAPLDKRTSKDKITFAFLGGKNNIKGYFFMKDILLKRSEQNWKIILVDTLRKFGEFSITQEEWEDRQTEILDYVPYNDIGNLFKKVDVLLFPSRCNESFGLLVREAIANNVFVVCSDCGGPSEAIVHGENGLVFPKDDETAFSQCLDYIFNNYQKIKNYRTTNFGDVRSFKAQADELHELYNRIL